MKHVTQEMPVILYFPSVDETSQEANLQESLGESTAERQTEHQKKGKRRTKVSDTAVTWLAGLIHEGPLAWGPHLTPQHRREQIAEPLPHGAQRLNG